MRDGRYSTSLINHLHQAQGLVALKKGEFLPLFWQAWRSTFTPELISKAFSVTGIYPPNADIILKRFTKRDSIGEGATFDQPEQAYRYYHQLLASSVKDPADKGAQELNLHLHHMHTKMDLLEMEKTNLQTALHHKQKYRHRGKALDLQQREEFKSRAVFWSPGKVKEARWREHVREEEEHEKKLQKARTKQQKEEAKLLHQVQLEERRVERQRLKEVREKERADKVAERLRNKDRIAAEKAAKQSQSCKRKALASIKRATKRQKRPVVDPAGGAAPERPSPPPARTTSHGRNVHLPAKFR
jgi:hypothetical protein